jgi:hypothetical protein
MLAMTIKNKYYNRSRILLNERFELHSNPQKITKIICLNLASEIRERFTYLFFCFHNNTLT